MPWFRLLALVLATGAGSPPQPTPASDEPPSFRLTGTQPENYKGVTVRGVGVDAEIRSIRRSPRGYGAYLTEVDARPYRGQRIELRARVSCDDIDGTRAWGGLWVRVDRAGESVALNNMRERPLRGTRAEHARAVTLDVPQDADTIAYGVLLVGAGRFRATNLTLRTMPLDAPTGMNAVHPTAIPAHPTTRDHAATDPAVRPTVASGYDLHAAGGVLFAAGAGLVAAPWFYRDGASRPLGIGMAIAGGVVAGIGAGMVAAAWARIRRPGFWLAKGSRRPQMSARAAHPRWTPAPVNPTPLPTGKRMLTAGMLTLAVSATATATGLVVLPSSRPAGLGVAAAGVGLLGIAIPLFVAGKRRVLHIRPARATVGPASLGTPGLGWAPGLVLRGRL